MKTKILGLLFVLCSFGFKNHTTVTLNVANDIVGLWYNDTKSAKIGIYLSSNNKYNGKIEWLREPNDANGNPKKDPKNPNDNLQNRDRLGMVILWNFEFNAKDNKWENGNIYDPNNGKTYSGYITKEGKDKLHLRGYIAGMTWLGRTSTWEKAE